MKFMAKRVIFVWALAALLGASLLLTSQKVQDAAGQLRQLERKIAAEREALAVLSAEWEYLNAPQRLENLAQEYFGMGAPQGGNLLAADEDLPFPAPLQNDTDGVMQKVSHEGGAEAKGNGL